MYCFKCPTCGYRVEQRHREPAPSHGPHLLGKDYYSTMVRDYGAEGVGIGSGVKVSRDGTAHEMGRLFLPGNDEYAGPGDPDGTKGMRKWHAEHRPMSGDGDRALVPGKIDRKVF